ncbi:hypothetical protein ANN_27170 [Periplaneta americana]|uniref:Uncharacterized protein n=1 Tax=Periplaneta americana TaxID=6978 RepID=A0ABQ8RXA1_PERAM|nr:hypothetical protein ANN_27170 [Periplaneta americana]
MSIQLLTRIILQAHQSTQLNQLITFEAQQREKSYASKTGLPMIFSLKPNLFIRYRRLRTVRVCPRFKQLEKCISQFTLCERPAAYVTLTSESLDGEISSKSESPSFTTIQKNRRYNIGSEIISNLKQMLEELDRISKEAGLSMNPEKTKLMTNASEDRIHLNGRH